MATKASIQSIGSVSLNGAWECKQAGTVHWFAATVPGCNFTDLVAAGRIEDPFYRDNEGQLQWIEKEDWIYRKTFEIDGDMLSAEFIDLVADGLDTFCDIRINGHPLASTDNMFVGHRIPCKTHLVAGENLIEVFFRSPINETMPRYLQAGYAYPAENDKSEEKLSVYCRKAPCHFGWDWGPRFVTSGIWRDISVQAYNHARIDDVHYTLVSLTDERAEVKFTVTVEGTLPKQSLLKLSSQQSDQLSATVTAEAFNNNQVCITCNLDNPKRWWPNGIGEAFLYTIDVVITQNEKTIDSHQTRIGLRTIEVVNQPDDLGVSFYVKVNGHSVFMKGANYIPADSFLNRMTTERHGALMDAAVDANMNMLRVWGGGIYQDDVFYRMADEKGLLVWQDFMFACTLYPGDDAFLENVKAEAEYNIKRLRNHPCIALWCGNNEVDMAIKHWEWPEKFGYSEAVYNGLRDDYKALFDTLLPSMVAKFDSNRFYMRSSPIGFWEEDADHIGNHHFWGVWHGEQPFSEYQKRIPRFMSEYGFQSFPVASSLNKFTEQADRDLQSNVLRVHQKHPRGNQLIHSYMEAEFQPPKDFTQLLYLSQVQQAEGLKLAFEAHRAAMPFCMGSLYWQLNDTWPAASWSGIDYYGKWKALHYQAKRSFAKQLLVITSDNNTVNIQVVNDALETKQGTLTLSLQDFHGKALWHQQTEVTLPATASQSLQSIDITEFKGNPLNACVLVASLDEGAANLAVMNHYFTPHKALKLIHSDIDVTATIDGDTLNVILQAPVLHRHVFVEVPDAKANFSDNFFDLLAGVQKVISVSVAGLSETEREQCQHGVVCQSLIDSFTG